MPYTALVLEQESHERLVAWFDSHHGIPEGWVLKGHHCTVDLKPVAKSMASAMNGERHEMRVVRFGVLPGIIAVEVETVVPSKNERKHITLCHHPETKPRCSNDITEWTEIEPFVLNGIVQEVQ